MDWLAFVERYDGVGAVIALALIGWHIHKCENRSKARWDDSKEIREKINDTNNRVGKVESDVSYIKGQMEHYQPKGT